MLGNGSWTSLKSGEGKTLKIKRKTVAFFLIVIFLMIICAFQTGNQFDLTKICTLILSIYCVWRGHREKCLMNPYYLFLPAPVSILLYNEQVSYIYLMKLDSATKWIILLSMISFVISLNCTKSGMALKLHMSEKKGDLILHSLILYGVAMTGILFPSFPLASIFKLCIYLSISCALKSKCNVLTVTLLLGYLALTINSANKTMLILLGMVIFICIYKYYKLTAKMYLLMGAAAILCAVLMLEMFNLKIYLSNGGTFLEYIKSGYKTVEYYSYYTRGNRIRWEGNTALMLPYMYLTTPWTNFQYVISSQPEHTYGLWMLKPLLGWFQMDQVFNKYYELNSYTNFNTFSYLSVLYKDGGILGCIIISGFLGFFVKRMYHKYRIATSPLDIACYGLTAVAVLEMFFSNHFFQQSYPFTIVVMAYLYTVIFNSIVKR